MTVASPSRMSFEDYLVGEATSELKHEWCDGVVYAMSRGTPEHARLTARVLHALREAAHDGCEVYASDLMLYVEAAKLSTYADATVVCGSVETKTVRRNGKSLGEAVTDPTIVVEVLSESTERYDRDGKFQAYQKLASLEEYVLVSQTERGIEVYRRNGATWDCDTAAAGGSVTIHGAKIAVNAIYE